MTASPLPLPLLFSVGLTLSLLACGGVDSLPGDEESTELTQSRATLKAGGGGGGGLGFSCDEPGLPGKCSCMGPKDSVDCKKMKRNCADEIQCGWAVDNCTCTLLRTAPKADGAHLPVTGGVELGKGN